jgi:hypothetical protein
VKFWFADPITAAAFEVWALAFHAKAPAARIAAAIAVVTMSFFISPLQSANPLPLGTLRRHRRIRNQSAICDVAIR